MKNLSFRDKLSEQAAQRAEKYPVSMITKCESCGFERTPIIPNDPASIRQAAFAGNKLECGHIVCNYCFPYCDACNPIPF